MVWVRFNREWEDGFAIYQKGGVYDIHPQKYDVYVTQYFISPDGSSQEKPPRPRQNPVCTKCDPPPDEPAGKGRSGNRGQYRFLDSVASPRASYAAGQVYDLPVEIGDKYVLRGIAERYTSAPQYQQAIPENAMRPASRK
jgi:hypothetical protein